MAQPSRYPGKVGLQQRVLPDYRADFMESLAARCDGGLSVFAGSPRPREAIHSAVPPTNARLTLAGNQNLLGGPLFLLRQTGLVAWLERTQPEILVLEANPRYLSNRLALRWMHERRRPVVGWGLGAPPARGLRGWVRRGWLRGFDTLIAYSSLGAAQYRALGFPAERVFVAPNATAPARSSIPAREPLSGRALRLFFVGRLQPRKRIDVLLQACAGLQPRPEVFIGGDGPDRARLEARAQEWMPEAHFLGDLRGEALVSAFARADVFVLPGTGGLALQQALAAGLPIIAAEGDGTPQDMVTSGNGWLVRPGDLADLRAALQHALTLDEGRLRAMGEASFRLARERFNLEAMTDAFVAALCAVTLRRR
jgi:glycosyltransferase involved in cell wall biosynthesis